MKTILNYFCLPLGVFFALAIFSSFMEEDHVPATFPYKQAGLTDRQAAAHLLGRFTYGAKPGDIDEAVGMGLEKWFSQQLKGDQADDSLVLRLKNYDALDLSNAEVLQLYPKNAKVLRMAVQAGVIKRDSIDKGDKKEYRDKIQSYMKDQGLKPQAELFRQLVNQKILRAAYTRNQTRELLTDFWFNHFNVSITKNLCAEFIPAYERDVIRPNVFGNFEDLVLKTAKSPAMLMYLDNFSSTGSAESLSQPLNSQVQKRLASGFGGRADDSSSQRSKVIAKLQQNKKNKGLNENYAREVMELHTLGVDGGYTQADVTQAARILTGWTVHPMYSNYGTPANNMLNRIEEHNFEKRGFVREGDFLFAANRHDSDEKTVLGQHFPANGGYQEGVQLLKMLSNHPSAARFISRKIAVRFVSDKPSQKLVDVMTSTFMKNKGNIAAVLISMVSAQEFWNAEALREKTKSPFELAISAVRSLDAEINQPYQLFNWITKMGQKIYYYQAPTGFPDQGQYWINTGSLLNRMNFGLALSSQRIPGVRIDLAALNKNREPESSEAALVAYASMIMPERDLGQTIARLRPMMSDPGLQERVEEAAAKHINPGMGMDQLMTAPDDLKSKARGKNTSDLQRSDGMNSMLSQVVGIILGSPEFQRK